MSVDNMKHEVYYYYDSFNCQTCLKVFFSATFLASGGFDASPAVATDTSYLLNILVLLTP